MLNDLIRRRRSVAVLLSSACALMLLFSSVARAAEHEHKKADKAIEMLRTAKAEIHASRDTFKGHKREVEQQAQDAIDALGAVTKSWHNHKRAQALEDAANKKLDVLQHRLESIEKRDGRDYDVMPKHVKEALEAVRAAKEEIAS